MTEHLPECWAKHESDPPAWCICDELRACEKRIKESVYPSVVRISDPRIVILDSLLDEQP
jgi:hypothetical protein